MTENSGRRRNIPGDPTAESSSDPVPTGQDVADLEAGEDMRGLATPRRYEQPVEADPVLPSDGRTPQTKQ
jgi:hypothetical protein